MSPSKVSLAAKCIFVLGMHRSGTSAFTGLLCRFGVGIGPDLLPANYSNPKGFFESKAVVDINNAILLGLGSSWDDMNALPIDWQMNPAMQAMRIDIAALLSSLAVAENPLVIKDPRLSKTLPLWLGVLRDFGVQPVVVICVREPNAVAQSEKLMKGFPLMKSLMLFLDYNLQAERNSRDFPRAIVTYSDLLADWKAVLRKVDGELGLALPLDAAGWEKRGADFISPELDRSRPEIGEFERCGTVGDMANALYEALRLTKANDVEELMQRFIAYQEDIKPWGAILQHVQKIEERFPTLDLGLRLGYSRMQSSVSWADGRLAEFDTANIVTSKWVYGTERKTIRLAFDRQCTADKFRLTFANRSCCVQVYSLVLQRGEKVLGQWSHLHELLIGHSKSSFDLSQKKGYAVDAWIFLDGKGYLDIKLPGDAPLALDSDCHFDLEIEVADVSTALKPLLASLTLSQKDGRKLRDQLQAINIKQVNENEVSGLLEEIANLNGLLQTSIETRDQKIASQQQMLDRMRVELLRAETQLDVLKDLLIGHLDQERL